MINLNKVLESLMVLKGFNTEELRITPKITIHIDKNLLERNRDQLVDFCKSLPVEDLSSWRQLKRHLGQDEFMTYYLIALGERLKVWDRFPSINIEWNVPDWPCAIPKNTLSRATDDVGEIK